MIFWTSPIPTVDSDSEDEDEDLYVCSRQLKTAWYSWKAGWLDWTYGPERKVPHGPPHPLNERLFSGH